MPIIVIYLITSFTLVYNNFIFNDFISWMDENNGGNSIIFGGIPVRGQRKSNLNNNVELKRVPNRILLGKLVVERRSVVFPFQILIENVTTLLTILLEQSNRFSRIPVKIDTILMRIQKRCNCNTLSRHTIMTSELTYRRSTTDSGLRLNVDKYLYLYRYLNSNKLSDVKICKRKYFHDVFIIIKKVFTQWTVERRYGNE